MTKEQWEAVCKWIDAVMELGKLHISHTSGRGHATAAFGKGEATLYQYRLEYISVSGWILYKCGEPHDEVIARRMTALQAKAKLEELIDD